METRICASCLIEKPISEFSKHKLTEDRRFIHCKECRNIQQKAYYKVHRKQCLKQKVDYYNSKHGQVIINKYRQSQKGREGQRRTSKNGRKNNPARIAAEHAIEHAVKFGKLPRANTHKCIICNKQAMDYHHNKGYAKKHWFDVIPVCRRCHASIHSKYSS